MLIFIDISEFWIRIRHQNLSKLHFWIHFSIVFVIFRILTESSWSRDAGCLHPRFVLKLIDAMAIIFWFLLKKVFQNSKSLVCEIVKKVHFLFPNWIFPFQQKEMLAIYYVEQNDDFNLILSSFSPELIFSFVQCNFKWGFEIFAVSKWYACIKRVLSLTSKKYN